MQSLHTRRPDSCCFTSSAGGVVSSTSSDLCRSIGRPLSHCLFLPHQGRAVYTKALTPVALTIATAHLLQEASSAAQTQAGTAALAGHYHGQGHVGAAGQGSCMQPAKLRMRQCWQQWRKTHTAALAARQRHYSKMVYSLLKVKGCPCFEQARICKPNICLR